MNSSWLPITPRPGFPALLGHWHPRRASGSASRSTLRGRLAPWPEVSHLRKLDLPGGFRGFVDATTGVEPNFIRGLAACVTRGERCDCSRTAYAARFALVIHSCRWAEGEPVDPALIDGRESAGGRETGRVVRSRSSPRLHGSLVWKFRKPLI